MDNIKKKNFKLNLHVIIMQQQEKTILDSNQPPHHTLNMPAKNYFQISTYN